MAKIDDLSLSKLRAQEANTKALAAQLRTATLQAVQTEARERELSLAVGASEAQLRVLLAQLATQMGFDPSQGVNFDDQAGTLDGSPAAEPQPEPAAPTPIESTPSPADLPSKADPKVDINGFPTK